MERWKQLFVHTDGQEPIVFGVNLRECEFAYGEVSMCVYAFYVRQED